MMYSYLRDCEELYKLSGWKDTEWVYGSDGMMSPIKVSSPLRETDLFPLYDLDYLLKKIPPTIWGSSSADFRLEADGKGTHAKWTAGYHDELSLFQPTGILSSSIKLRVTCAIPRDAVLRLVIELFKRNLL